MSKLILPPGVASGKAQRVGVEIRGDDKGNVLLNFEREVKSVVYTAQEAAEIARALARGAVDQAKHGPDPLKGILQ